MHQQRFKNQIGFISHRFLFVILSFAAMEPINQ